MNTNKTPRIVRHGQLIGGPYDGITFDSDGELPITLRFNDAVDKLQMDDNGVLNPICLSYKRGIYLEEAELVSVDGSFVEIDDLINEESQFNWDCVDKVIAGGEELVSIVHVYRWKPEGTV